MRTSHIGLHGATFFVDIRAGGSDTLFLPEPVQTPMC